ncbi:basic amino acid ABC transporter substrate-binding protein [Glaciimonas immobilis]|uniref:Polar amino acid transport system substrate-binding protein n=1 Tax=Glaciimonas immobilis TaxID=728004 RepID=A0A840RUK1_9BURK|nr:basic amino acid ABC transporter substrate-binding protein [Glaciimonas immobilis]KAF3997571.1 basic amino acid ABC transporter substrate-binding protein [Glaciimonas immobilis]MBB5200738.1 polar amino acid transport system substrate-binding protein [Glaciimonas immobilis]
MKRNILPLLALTCVCAALAACGKSAPKTSASPADAANLATVEYVVGTDAAYAPFSSMNAQKEAVGFEIDTIKAIAERAGIHIKVVNTPFDGIFNALAQGDRDILISSITITDLRKQTVDFTNPYFEANQLIVVPIISGVKQFADLKTLKIGVQSATTGDEASQRLVGKNNPNVKRFESMPLAFQELDGGGVDAVVGDNGVVVNYVKNNNGKNFKVITDPAFPKEYYGIAVKKGNTALLAKLNKGLADIKADGTADKIYAKYFAD